MLLERPISKCRVAAGVLASPCLVHESRLVRGDQLAVEIQLQLAAAEAERQVVPGVVLQPDRRACIVAGPAFRGGKAETDHVRPAADDHALQRDVPHPRSRS